jgi:hypothetical protein
MGYARRFGFGAAWLVVWSLLVSPVLAGQTWQAAGVVFLDADADGNLSPGEKGFAAAVVSDGLSVLKSDEAGKFRLDAGIDETMREGQKPVVALSVPDGHRATTSWFARLSGDANHDLALAFGLAPRKQTRPFEFVHVTDTHWPRGGKEVYEAFVQEMKQGADRFRFVIDTGDLGDKPNTMDPNTSRYQLEGHHRMVGQIGLPYYTCPGNHDVIDRGGALRGWATDDPDFGYGIYLRMHGPIRWSFTYAGVHFIGVDALERKEGNLFVVGCPAPALRWLKADMDAQPKDAPVLVFGHFFKGDGWADTIRGRNVKGVFYGHGHGDKVGELAGAPFIESGSLSQMFIGLPAKRGYRVVKITEDGRMEHSYKLVADGKIPVPPALLKKQ